MKKKLVILLLSTSFILSACGNAKTNASPTSENNSVESTMESTETTENLSELDALGDVDVEENLFSVTLTIPADYVGETTQEELDAMASENGYKSIILNSDGSATYTMTKAQHEAMMDEMTASLNGSLAEMIGSEDYPNITDIKANENFTEFTITTKSTELDMNESFSVLAFYMYGGMYNIFKGAEVDNISVTFINADSGEIISTSNSSEIAE